MADFTFEEQQMMARFWGEKDLVNNEGFWASCLILYQDKLVALPIADNPSSRRRLAGMLDCNGSCSLCCHYAKVHLTESDLARLPDDAAVCKDEKGSYLDCKNGCQFLKDGKCSIYDIRPDVCYDFPIQSPRTATTPDGREIQQVQYRLKCVQGLKVIRQLMAEAVAGGKLMLLPDLSLINKEEDGIEKDNLYRAEKTAARTG
ncbi:MAG: YkgJ family cysteine cluster protein [Candidatus Paceibacterota bacterium]|jgi:Fe-S-cluster containining protein